MPYLDFQSDRLSDYYLGKSSLVQKWEELSMGLQWASKSVVQLEKSLEHRSYGMRRCR